MVIRSPWPNFGIEGGGREGFSLGTFLGLSSNSKAVLFTLLECPQSNLANDAEIFWSLLFFQNGRHFLENSQRWWLFLDFNFILIIFSMSDVLFMLLYFFGIWVRLTYSLAIFDLLLVDLSRVAFYRGVEKIFFYSA